MANSTILTAEREAELRKPIDEYVGNIQAQINDLRRDGTDKAVSIQNSLDTSSATTSTPRRKKPRGKRS